MTFDEERYRQAIVGEPRPLANGIVVVPYDPEWPRLYAAQADRVRTALGDRALRIEHTGSTSVADLPAKPIVDMVLLVADSADEASYVPDLERAGYQLRVREPDWHEHRMLRDADPDVHLHVFSEGCPEVGRVLAFRDWLRKDQADRELYARTKMDLAQRDWTYMQEYANAKTQVVEGILARALA